MRDIQIQDASLSAELERDGYAVVPGLDMATISDFREAIYNEIRDFDHTRLNFNTGYDLAGPIRDQVFDKIERTFTPILDKHFANYQVVVGIMFVKRPSTDAAGQVGLHFDPTLLPDETRQKHLNIWSPLIDVDETNGALWVVPRSHKVFAPVHAPSIPSPTAGITDTVLKYGECIRMKAGECLVFDNRLIHYSRQNFSADDRPCLILSIVPSEADIITLFKSDEPGAPIEVYRQSRRWYRDTEWLDGLKRPKTGRFLGYLNYGPRPLSVEEFIDLMESRRFTGKYKFELKT